MVYIISGFYFNKSFKKIIKMYLNWKVKFSYILSHHTTRTAVHVGHSWRAKARMTEDICGWPAPHGNARMHIEYGVRKTNGNFLVDKHLSWHNKRRIVWIYSH